MCNPICTLFDINLKKLLEDPYSRICKQILVEVSNFCKKTLNFNLNVKEAFEYFDSICKKFPNHKTSMYEDFWNPNSKQLEIDFLNGFIAKNNKNSINYEIYKGILSSYNYKKNLKDIDKVNFYNNNIIKINQKNVLKNM
jgi:hypothetical protein